MTGADGVTILIIGLGIIALIFTGPTVWYKMTGKMK